MPSAGDRRSHLYGLSTALVVGFDALTKQAAESQLRSGDGLAVFGEWFQLRLVYNPGAAFGLHVGEHSRWVLMAIAVVAVVLLTRLAAATPRSDRFRLVALGLIAGGALGNLIDRIRHPLGVVDFLDLGIGALRWPTFNLADVGVACGAIALAVSLWLEDARRDAAAAGTRG